MALSSMAASSVPAIPSLAVLISPALAVQAISVAAPSKRARTASRRRCEESRSPLGVVAPVSPPGASAQAPTTRPFLSHMLLDRDRRSKIRAAIDDFKYLLAQQGIIVTDHTGVIEAGVRLLRSVLVEVTDAHSHHAVLIAGCDALRTQLQ
jgi:hypothetical protein